MANQANKVFVGKPLVTGGIWAAPVGTPLPTDATTALNAAFKGVGYVTDAGVTKTVTRDTDTVVAWGGDTIALIQGSFSAEFKFAMAEYLNAITQTLLYGAANVTATSATGTDTVAVSVTSEATPHNSWVIEMKQGDGRVRIVIPDGAISDTGDVVYQDSDVASLDVTVTAFADSTARFFYEYMTSKTTVPAKNNATPGTVFPAEATVTASDSTNAAKLAGLGYIANPTTAWTTGQKITVGTFDFNWSGAAWAAGAHA